MFSERERERVDGRHSVPFGTNKRFVFFFLRKEKMKEKKEEEMKTKMKKRKWKRDCIHGGVLGSHDDLVIGRVYLGVELSVADQIHYPPLCSVLLHIQLLCQHSERNVTFISIWILIILPSSIILSIPPYNSAFSLLSYTHTHTHTQLLSGKDKYPISMVWWMRQ